MDSTAGTLKILSAIKIPNRINPDQKSNQTQNNIIKRHKSSAREYYSQNSLKKISFTKRVKSMCRQSYYIDRMEPVHLKYLSLRVYYAEYGFL